MGNLGRNVENYASGYDDSIIAAGDPEWLLGGATVDWTTVPATTAQVTQPTGRVIPAGKQFLDNGQFMARVVATRKFAPYDPAQVQSGAQSIAHGDCGLVERTVVFGGTLGLNTKDDTHIGLITGGHVYLGVINQVGTGTASVAGGPTRATLEAALPTLVLTPRT